MTSIDYFYNFKFNKPIYSCLTVTDPRTLSFNDYLMKLHHSFNEPPSEYDYIWDIHHYMSYIMNTNEPVLHDLPPLISDEFDYNDHYDYNYDYDDHYEEEEEEEDDIHNEDDFEEAEMIDVDDMIEWI